MFELIAIVVGLGFTNHSIIEDHCTNCNEIHPNLRAEFSTPIEDVNAFVLSYHNSQNTLSLSMGMTYRPLSWETGPHLTWEPYVEASLVAGYDYAPVVPFARLGLDVRHESGFGVGVFAFPSTDGNTVLPAAGVEAYYRWEW